MEFPVGVCTARRWCQAGLMARSGTTHSHPHPLHPAAGTAGRAPQRAPGRYAGHLGMKSLRLATHTSVLELWNTFVGGGRQEERTLSCMAGPSRKNLLENVLLQSMIQRASVVVDLHQTVHFSEQR